MERCLELRLLTESIIRQIGISNLLDVVDAVKLSQSPFLMGSTEHIKQWCDPSIVTPLIPWLNYGKFSRSYHENLRSQAWLELSHLLKERAYHCIVCASTKRLHLHHTFYSDAQYSTIPWLYPLTSLVTVCRSCHDEIHSDPNWKTNQFQLFKHYDSTDWSFSS